MYKIGDKVRPLRKTIGKAWGECSAINEMNALKQDFLYVSCVFDGGTVGCNVVNSEGSLSEFATSDLEPYESHSNLIEIDGYNLFELIKNGYFKEDVRFYVSKQ